MPTRREFIHASAAGLAALATSTPAWSKPTRLAASRPNVLFVIADQHRRSSMGYVDSPETVRTPRLDRFSQQSVDCRHAMSNFPLCGPWRGMAFSGQRCFSNGVVQNNESFFPDTTTLFDCFNDAGYRCDYIGKWHLSMKFKQADERPQRFWKWHVDPETGVAYQMLQRVPSTDRPKFDYWLGNEAYNDLFSRCYYENDDEQPTIGRGWQPEFEIDRAVQRLQHHAKESAPFAMVVSINPPHPGEIYTGDGPLPIFHGYHAPEDFLKQYHGRMTTDRPNYRALTNRHNTLVAAQVPGYYGAITSVDQEFGRLLDGLEQAGLDDDTIVIYAADHGEMMGSHGDMGKRLWFEESVNVPLLIRWPKKLKPAQIDTVFGAQDIMPTLLGMCGLPIPESVEGRDFSADFTAGRSDQSHDQLLEYTSSFDRVSPMATDYQQRTSRWFRLSEGEWRAVRTLDATYCIQLFRGTTTRYLYDLRRDPFQVDPQVWVDEKPGAGTGDGRRARELEDRLRQMLADDPRDKFLAWLDNAEPRADDIGKPGAWPNNPFLPDQY
jgi:arylsulfatase A-like enzyme